MPIDQLWMEDFPPLDIKVLANNIAHLWMIATREAEHRARRDFQAYQEMGIEPRFEFTTNPTEGAKLRDQVVAQLTAFDAGRTDALRFYKNELIRLHRLWPSAPVILEKPKP